MRKRQINGLIFHQKVIDNKRSLSQQQRTIATAAAVAAAAAAAATPGCIQRTADDKTASLRVVIDIIQIEN